jgi:hypothetical protein
MNDVLSLTMRRHGLVVVDSDDDLVVDFGHQQYCNIEDRAQIDSTQYYRY